MFQNMGMPCGAALQRLASGRGLKKLAKRQERHVGKGLSLKLRRDAFLLLQVGCRQPAVAQDFVLGRWASQTRRRYRYRARRDCLRGWTYPAR
jgi:hypothetical protein